MLLLLIFIGLVLRIVAVKKQYAYKSITAYQIGETIELQDVNMRVDHMVFDESNEEQKLVLVTCSFTNTTNQSLRYDTTSLTLTSNALHQQTNLMLFATYNEGGLYVDLAPQETKTLVYPFSIEKYQVTKKQWSMMDKQPYQLIISLYPDKRYVHLN